MHVRGQDEGKQKGTKQEYIHSTCTLCVGDSSGQLLIALVNRQCTSMKIGASLTSTLGTSLFSWQMETLSLKKTNGCLHPHLFATLVCCSGTALSVHSRGIVDRVFRDVIERYAVP